MRQKKQLCRYWLATAPVIAAALLVGGCGGASTNTAGLRPTPAAQPAIYGLEPSGVVNTGVFLETSGLATPDGKTGYLTGAVSSTVTKPISTLDVNGTIPLGFAPDGSYINHSIGIAVNPGAAVRFAAYASNGTDPLTSQVIPIVTPNGVTLTSSDFGLSNLVLPFVGAANIGSGALANGQYAANFTIPASTTTGLHSLTASIADTSGQKTSTTFDTVVVRPGDVAFYTAVTEGPDGSGATAPTPINPGDVAELDSAATGTKVAVLGARQQATADAQGTIILFVPAGRYTFKTTSSSGVVTTQEDSAGKPAVLDFTKDGGKAVVQ